MTLAFYKSRGRLGGMKVAEARRPRVLDGENSKPKKLLAEAMYKAQAQLVG
jgi:hypothetical protein